MIITISGLPGAGKSTVGRLLAQKLHYPFYSMGNMRRQAALARGLTLAEFNRLGESDPSTDTMVDDLQVKLGQEQKDFVIEGRTGWYFLPQSKKIFLRVDPLVGAQRIFQSLAKNRRPNEDKNLNDVNAVVKSTAERLASDRRRYEKYINADVYDESHYDIIIDTSRVSIDEVVRKLENFLKS